MKRVLAVLVPISVLTVLLCAAVFQLQSDRSIHIIGKETDRLLVTADHLPEESFEGYIKIYSIPETDTAVYYNTNYKPIKPDLNTRVVIDDCVNATITDVQDYTFTVRVDDFNDTHYGMSGMSVISSTGDVIGFVSAINSKDTLLCVTY